MCVLKPVFVLVVEMSFFVVFFSGEPPVSNQRTATETATEGIYVGRWIVFGDGKNFDQNLKKKLKMLF